jgi:formamidopyrimidine-DNA glycosylase
VPELPEVETVRRTLAPALGLRVADLWVGPLPLRLGRPVDRAGLREIAVGSRIEGLRRHGKYLLVDFAESGGVLVVHLGMSGRLRLVEPGETRAPHTHVVFSLARPRGRAARHELRYSDPRRFGFLSVAWRGREREHPALAVLGLDPLTEADRLTGAYLLERTRGRRRPLKLFLLDQGAVAGLGNIYVCEALWQAGLSPLRPAERLDRAAAGRLARAITRVLARALDHGGTSLRDFVAADGVKGEHSHYLWVYGREEEPCRRRRCGAPIRRIVLQGRATFFCPSCQQD